MADAVRNAKKTESDGNEQENHLQIVSRVTNLSFVATAISYAENTYERAKNASPSLVQKTLSAGEETLKYFIRFAVTTTTPVLQKWKGPIRTLDSVACTIFDKVNETVVTVAKQPDEALTTIRSTVGIASEQVRVYLDSLSSPDPATEASDKPKSSMGKWVVTMRRVMAIPRQLLSRRISSRRNYNHKETSDANCNARVKTDEANASISKFKSLENLSILVDRLTQQPVHRRKSRPRRPVLSVSPLTDEERDNSTLPIEKSTGFRAFIRRDADSQSEKSGASECDEEVGTVVKRTKKSHKPRFTVRLYPHQLPYMNY